jgi:16S rRNA (uracil1498-N3)-methyltransferase
MKLKDAVTLTAATRILLAESEQEVLLRDALDALPPREDVVLALGPEGGWTEAELEMFRAAGWTSASLGRTILRAETAAIAALAVVISELHRTQP